MRVALSAAAFAAFAVGFPVATISPAHAACVPAAAPITTLDRMAAGTPLAGKKVGAGWDAVILGTVTEVRHKSPKFRYRITMNVDSTLGADLPRLYTFFGSSRGTFEFETGKAYAVPVARRGGRGPVLPTTELWVDACDPVVPVADLPAAHEVIAKTKPGYTPSPTATPSPTPSPSPSEEVLAAAVVTTPSAAPAVTVARGAHLDLPERDSLARTARALILIIGTLGLLVALIAAAESWWSRRHFA